MIEATCRFILRHIALSRFTRRERAPGARRPLLPCYSRAASVLVSEPTQHFGYVANSRSRFPILQSRNATSAWRALRRAASPLAASRHRLRSRRTYTWPREAAAPPLVKVRLPFGAEVQCTGSAIWRTAFLSSHPPFSSFFPLSFFSFLWASFFSIAGNQGQYLRLDYSATRPGGAVVVHWPRHPWDPGSCPSGRISLQRHRTA